MLTRKRILGFGAIAVVGLVTTFALAFMACAFEWSALANRTATIPFTFGKTAASGDSLAWYWFASKLRMRTDVVSIVVPAQDVQRWIDGYKPPASQELPAAPWWTVSREQGDPPKRETPPELLAADDLPRVGDIGFGWPLPCIAYRVDFLEVRETTAEENADMIRASQPNLVTKYVREPKMAYGHFNGRFLIDSGHSGYWPTRILWPNLLIDWAVVAALLVFPFLLFSSAAAWRSKRRQAQNRCPRCGYSRAGTAPSDLCPECGLRPDTVPSRAKLSPRGEL